MSERDTDTTTSSISSFYDEQSVFVTGATGFVGKVLIEKLLRCSAKLKAMYVLVRPQRGKTAKQRTADMLTDRVFDHLRTEQPTFTNKIIVCEGDIMKPNLGLSEEDTATITDNVSVVFHSAATVKFDEPLKLSVKMNVVGVKQLIALCHRMTNLKALIHISTAYSHCDRSQIDETIYPPSLPPDKLIETLNLCYCACARKI
ncbi:putative fatty acyl-CoA reductase CG5065 [Corticium candelabrum]|uniref:putative fatty acyl-CoA reductase CG5065 n=1 Tax=Corticium candelabrum TaxID=121492 RepID=UPI002E274F34|nr:putative fatty acyl-CoA reductase CG5065 [Corticium candelabrum]